MKLLLGTIFLFVITSVFSQEDRNAYINGYDDKYYNQEYFYFDSLNKLWNKEITCFNVTSQVYASFKVDTNSNLIDLQIIELPVFPLPQLMKAYIEKLITSTSGKWIPQKKNNQKVVSDEIIYRFDFLKENQTVQERIDATSKIIEYHFDNGYYIEIVRKFDDIGKSKIFTLLY